ncbi:MAG: excalibur calcium-binding domain-containing protein [Actinomycetota bacterium]|nr:excalibur calcium-binding domain-containing protein [Actinomycetota bacterium]
MRRLLAVVGVLVLLLAMAPASASVVGDAPRSCGRAEVTKENRTLRRDLRTRGDVDWYRFEVDTRARLSVILRPPADYTLDLYRTCRRLVGASDNPGRGLERIAGTFRRGTSFVRIRATLEAQRSWTRGRDYRLRFNERGHGTSGAGPSLGPRCDPNYTGGCVPVYPPDVNCGEVDGPVRVVGRDVHGLDGDGDGIACE